MTQTAHDTLATTSVSMAFTMATEPTRDAAFRLVAAAVLHAGFAFGRDRPGQVMCSYDAQGEDDAAPRTVPAGSLQTLAQALEYLAELAHQYNQTISLSFACSHATVPVTWRVYDAPDTLYVSLDFDTASWRQLVQAGHSLRTATTALLDAGRMLWTLLPLPYLLIGPTHLLLDIPHTPNATLLRNVPVAFLADGAATKARSGRTVLQAEALPRGSALVRQWDAGAVVTLTKPKAARPKAKSRARSDEPVS